MYAYEASLFQCLLSMSYLYTHNHNRTLTTARYMQVHVKPIKVFTLYRLFHFSDLSSTQVVQQLN